MYFILLISGNSYHKLNSHKNMDLEPNYPVYSKNQPDKLVKKIPAPYYRRERALL